MKCDYIVLKQGSKLVFWKVPRRKATKRLWALLQKIHREELEVAGLVEGVPNKAEAARYWELNQALSGEDMLERKGFVFRSEAKN
jgi:hypothetical protein